MTPFDIKNIIDSKTKVEWDSTLEKDYNSFLINKAYSFNEKYIFFSNAMNGIHFVPKKWQFDFYYFGLPKGKRFDKWVKSDDNDNQDNIDLVSAYFSINKSRAEEYLKLLTKQQIKIIAEKMNKGGI